MRVLVTILLGGLALSACTTTPPNDGDQYFDNITPDPIALQQENSRLATAETGGVTNVQLPAETQTAAVTPPLESGTGISNTQDFGTITQQESIQSDAAKLEALAADYQQVQPEALPQRDASVNIAAYAISQKNPVGQRIYRRSSNGSNCGRYRNDPDEAQRVFLANGGPDRDRRGLDPDGDGFACTWDPEKYRRLVTSGG